MRTLPYLPCRRIAVTVFLGGLFLLLPARAQDLTKEADIGSPSGGSNSYSAGTYTITGMGQGVQFSGYLGVDKMRFVYQEVTGDIEIKARVVSFDNTGEGNVGLAIRSGLGTGDQMGTALFVPNHFYVTAHPWLINWSRGPLSDGHSDYYDSMGKGDTPHPGLKPPFWLKLVRVGNNYGGYWSLDGKDWYLLHDNSGGAFFPSGPYNVGIFVSSGSDTASSTAVIDHVTVTTPQPRYKTSWVGTTSAGVAAGPPANQIYSLWVKPDGTCYAEGNWCEGSSPGRLYRDGKVLHNFYGPNGGGLEGQVTGNATHLFYFDFHGDASKVWRSDFATNDPTALNFADPLGLVRGLAASANTIFVSDCAHGKVRAVDAATLTEITTGHFPITLPRCGPIAYDGTNFWVVQAATHVDYPLSWYVVGTDPASILCFAPDGTPLPDKTITWKSPDVCVPTALAYQDLGPAGPSPEDVLWVCDNSPHQFIRRYTNLIGTPKATTPFGVDGGAFSGATPGLLKDPAAGGDQRLYGPTGVGTDSSGNIYVACNGASHFVTDVRKYDSAGTLQWRINGLVFVQVGDFDPKTGDDGANIYLPEKHLTMNYANTAPGSEWSYQSFTRDLTKNDLDARNGGNSMGINACATKLARLGSPANLYMYTGGQGNTGTMCLYYFNGEIAVPYGAYFADGSGNRLWIDANNNKIHDPGEETPDPATAISGGFQSYDVDALGDVWMMFAGGVRRLVNQGAAPLGGVAGQPSVPTYSISATGLIDYKLPEPLVAGYNVSFDSATDTMYLIGKTSAGAWKLVRCDHWKANPESQLNPVATWAVTLPSEPDLSILYPLPALDQYMGMDLAVDKLFVAEQYGPAHVYDAALGNLELTLVPGPEISAGMGWVDMSMGINASKRSTGEYLVIQDQTGFNACDFLYRWTPSADTTVSAAPTGLTAAAGGRKVTVSWDGPTGMITSYQLYRGTSSGSETLYQSGIKSPTFTDRDLTPGATYFYKVTAVNTVGESAQSNEASAAAVSSQVEFVKTDTTTQGNWKGVYGADGYEICNNATSYPGYASVTCSTEPDPVYYPIPPNEPVPCKTFSWVDPTSDIRGLQKAGDGTDRIAAYRSSNQRADPFSWHIDADTGWHQVAIYLLDWNTPHRPTTVVKIYDATGQLLDTRRPGDYQQGKYLVWNFCGNIRIQISEPNFPNYTICSGLFFDPVKAGTPTGASANNAKASRVK